MEYSAEFFTSNLFKKMDRLPPFNTTERGIGRNWCAWKQNFLHFLQTEDPTEHYKKQWSTILLKLIDPSREQVFRYLPKEDNLTENFELLLRNLDVYFIFGTRKKKRDENIDKYIDNLMLVAIGSNHSDPVSVVKEKIIQDIKYCNFTEKAMLFVQSKGTNLVSYLQSLNLHKIMLFWKQCEEKSQEDCGNARNQISPPLLRCMRSAEMECVRCGGHHSRNRCPAHGIQCDNCKGYNHFKENCRVKYVSNCTKCGTNHVQSRCLAYGELCTNCGKSNHFSWLCRVPIVRDCPRCGFDHAVSMCPAQGKICTRCNKPNHFKEKCLSNVSDEEE